MHPFDLKPFTFVAFMGMLGATILMTITMRNMVPCFASIAAWFAMLPLLVMYCDGAVEL